MLFLGIFYQDRGTGSKVEQGITLDLSVSV